MTLKAFTLNLLHKKLLNSLMHELRLVNEPLKKMMLMLMYEHPET